MRSSAVSIGLLALAVTLLAGCGSKAKVDGDSPKSDAEPQKRVAAKKDDPAKDTGGTKATPDPKGVAAPKSSTGGTSEAHPENKTDAADGVLAVDARTLIADYADDELAANTKYKGKVLRLKGVVKSSTNYVDAVSIYNGTNLKAAEVQCKVGTDGMKAIKDHNLASWRPDVKGKVKQVNTGVTVVVQGTCKGLARKNAIVLDGCEVIDPVLLK